MIPPFCFVAANLLLRVRKLMVHFTKRQKIVYPVIAPIAALDFVMRMRCRMSTTQ
jgi:hypothetical protein